MNGVQFVLAQLANRHVSALHAVHPMSALCHASIGTVCSSSCMYVGKATAFVSAADAVMQVHVGNRDSSLIHCRMCKLSKILVGRRKQEGSAVVACSHSSLQAHILQSHTYRQLSGGTSEMSHNC